MKKLLSIGLLTVCALAVSERPAHAWVNAKFSVGLNWQIQSGNNNFFWGAWKNGQVPGPEAFSPGGYGAPPGGNFPYFGQGPQGYPQGAPQAVPAQTPPPQSAMQQQSYGNQPAYSPYQNVSYQHNGGYYYPSYYYPANESFYNYYGPAPSYWYQGR